jgi:hypothetical protein
MIRSLSIFNAPVKEIKVTTLQVRKLRAFVYKVQHDAVHRELPLLRAIEETLDVLDLRCEGLRQANEAADRFITMLRNDEFPASNGDASLVDLFEEARDVIGNEYAASSEKHVCAINAPELEDEDGIVDAYALLLTEMAVLHEKLNTMCWLLREHEADNDETLPGVFSNADGLFEAMGV